MSMKVKGEAPMALDHRLGCASAGEPATWKAISDGPPLGMAEPVAGLVPKSVEDWLWGEEVEVQPLLDPAAYGGVDALLALPPDTVLELSSEFGPEDRARYCRASADVTMRGGTTSGVVYPLAVCEIARRFRLRNIGGASAGAIAAAAAAAAEVGRGAGGASSPVAPEWVVEGHVRTGFPGLADSMAWLAQRDRSGDKELYRLAQLFQPTARARPLFRIVTTVFRRTRCKPLVLPLLLVGAFGPVTKALVLIALLGSVWLLLLQPLGTSGIDGMTVNLMGHALDVQHAVAAVLGLVGVTVLAVGVVLLIASAREPASVPDDLNEPVAPTTNLGATRLLPGLAAAVVGVAACLSATWGLGQQLRALALAWPALILSLLAVLGSGVLRLLLNARESGFGLVSGAVIPGQRRNLLDVIAGVPKRTGVRPLVTWLSETLAELAGLPDKQVLRFGHLWFGADYQPGKSREDLLSAAEHPRRRRVNLELVTSELVQRRSYRFPLPPFEESGERDADCLYFCVDDLYAAGREVFPAEVMDALTSGPCFTVRDVRGSSTEEFVVYRLPQSWDLPVIFAVRLSLSLPALFQAVPLYREVFRTNVRDEFGRELLRNGDPVKYPLEDLPEGKFWAEQLWFSDGGITSNFPIDMFDSPLPLWPTLGINLGQHPPGFASQDVWLPQDWQGQSHPSSPLSKSMLSFVAGIVDTARSWRDTEQTFMPGFRGRVAWVRQRSDEGGGNLFMPSEVIAGLALRGVFAGARLRRRFGDNAFWNRHQWLRLRTSLGNLAELSKVAATAAEEPPYQDLLGGQQAGPVSLIALVLASNSIGDPTPPPPVSPDPWYRPVADEADEFWCGARTMASSLQQANEGSAPLTDGVPEPAPALRQTPSG